MITRELFNDLLPLACTWAEEQERIILRSGIPLNEDQQIDAYLVGVRDIFKVRLLKVDHIPIPLDQKLSTATDMAGLLSPDTIGITYRYGILIRADQWHNRKLIVHELTHTMQYEKLGGFDPFLSQYLNECITFGYPSSSLEQEAKMMANKICDN